MGTDLFVDPTPIDTQHLSKAAMARRMNTSRSQLDRLLDPTRIGVSLETMHRAASVLGRKLHTELR